MKPCRPSRNLITGLWCIALLAGPMAGCEEDQQEVVSGPSGEGTLDSPYLIRSGLTYHGIPMEKGGTLFFISLDPPAGWNTLNTVSAVDINLIVSGFEHFFGDDAGGSFTPGSGNETFGVLGNGESELYFQVEGARVLSNGAAFDISLLPAGVPVDVLVQNLASCPFAPPNESCEQNATDVTLPFAVAPDAPLRISITEDIFARHVFFTASNCSNCGPGDRIPFASNDIFVPFANPGFCHANSNFYTGVIGTSGTCTVNPVPGFGPPVRLRVANDTSFGGHNARLTFLSP